MRAGHGQQYLARCQLRALPAEITRLERRLAALTQDIATAETHATQPVTIGTQPYSRHDALEVLGTRLVSLPAVVYETRAVALGLSRGLRFGLVQHPQGAPEVYVEGALRRSIALARDVHGPRAILNAVERLIGSAAMERNKTTRDLAIAQGQRRDYKARLGAGFAHTAYLHALTDLRHQLEAALSSTAQESAEASRPTVGNRTLATSFSVILFAIASPVLLPESSVVIGHVVDDCVSWCESWCEVSHMPPHPSLSSSNPWRNRGRDVYLLTLSRLFCIFSMI